MKKILAAFRTLGAIETLLTLALFAMLLTSCTPLITPTPTATTTTSATAIAATSTPIPYWILATQTAQEIYVNVTNKKAGHE